MGLEDRTLAQAVKHSDLLTSSFLVLERMFEMLISDTPLEFDAKQRQQVGLYLWLGVDGGGSVGFAVNCHATQMNIRNAKLETDLVTAAFSSSRSP